ncbi:flagellar hook basal body protein [Shewanella mangrovi]|uniref:Flagellar hook-basal body complex protein FliE n=1 Tax=Shewanella mangrovi TaxID=1515746 RepID=A0A094LSK6_9GAMM|nr:flagellar hook-basal body complex protein FliE [Shewanella mangrovi]KFZ38173.1 flagellar hook basal body protein [Shewanella mangrovi]
MNSIETQSLLLSRMNSMEQIAKGDEIAPAQNGGFKQDFMTVIHDINAQQNLAADMMRAVDTGESQDVVGTMITSQKASLSFNMLMEVRNKVLDGLDDVMHMSL